MSEIRHNYGGTDRMARRLTQHAERLHGAAGPHSGNAHKRLLKHHGQDPPASAVANGSTKILDVIRKAEGQLQEHLRNMAKGLQQTSKNHEQNDKNPEDALKRVLRLDSKADGVRRAQGPEHNEHKGSPNYDKIMDRVHAMEADHINELRLGGQPAEEPPFYEYAETLDRDDWWRLLQAAGRVPA